MSNAAPLVVIAFIMVALIGWMMLASQSADGVRRDAEKLIADARRGAIDSVPSGEVVFRMPRLSVLLYFLVFSLMLCAGLYVMGFKLGSLNGAGHAFTGSSYGIVMLLSLLPLGIAVGQWKYDVRVSETELTISNFTTRTVQLREISEVTVDTYRASPFCRIQLSTGEEDLIVRSGIAGFLEFVKLLSQRVKRAKASA